MYPCARICVFAVVYVSTLSPCGMIRKYEQVPVRRNILYIYDAFYKFKACSFNLHMALKNISFSCFRHFPIRNYITSV